MKQKICRSVSSTCCPHKYQDPFLRWWKVSSFLSCLLSLVKEEEKFGQASLPVRSFELLRSKTFLNQDRLPVLKCYSLAVSGARITLWSTRSIRGGIDQERSYLIGEAVRPCQAYYPNHINLTQHHQHRHLEHIGNPAPCYSIQANSSQLRWLPNHRHPYSQA